MAEESKFSNVIFVLSMVAITEINWTCPRPVFGINGIPALKEVPSADLPLDVIAPACGNVLPLWESPKTLTPTYTSFEDWIIYPLSFIIDPAVNVGLARYSCPPFWSAPVLSISYL